VVGARNQFPKRLFRRDRERLNASGESTQTAAALPDDRCRMRIKQHDKSYIVELADGSAWRIDYDASALLT